MPVSVGKAIGQLIISLSNNEKIENIPDFKYSRYLNTSHESFILDFEKRAKKLINDNELKQLTLF